MCDQLIADYLSCNWHQPFRNAEGGTTFIEGGIESSMDFEKSLEPILGHGINGTAAWKVE